MLAALHASEADVEGFVAQKLDAFSHTTQGSTMHAG